MNLDWTDLGAALAMVCIIEGILPFINPARMRRVLLQLSGADDRKLRLGGFISMLVGVVVLCLVRS